MPRRKRTTALDRTLISIIEIAMVLSVVVVVLFTGYLLGGTLVSQTDGISLPYRFLSMNDDPVFNTLATATGMSLGTGCIALVLFELLSPNNSVDASIAIFFALVGFGLSAGLVRISMPVTLRFLVQFIP